MVTQVVPVQGPAPGVFNGQEPTLIPNFGKNVTGLSGGGQMSPAQFLAANPRVDATATATIGGSVTTGDVVELSIFHPLLRDALYGGFPNGIFTASYTTVGGDTIGVIAAKLAALFNDNPSIAALGLRVDTGGASDAVMTFRQSGPVGNFSVLSTPQEGNATVTVAGTALTGDVAYINFSGGALGVVTPAVCGVVLGGTTFGVGDTFPLTFTNANVAGLPITITYTVVAGDTLATIMAGLLALFAANATLAANFDIIQTGPAGFDVVQQGLIGNSTVLTSTPGHAGGGNGTVVFAPTNGALRGGSGQAGGVTVNFPITTGNTSVQVAAGLVAAIAADPDLVALGITATNGGTAVVTIVLPAAIDPVVVATWVNTGVPTLTVAGSPAIGDTVGAQFTGTGLTGSPVTVTTPAALVGATAASQAAALAAVINANTNLAKAGIGAGAVGAVVTITGMGGSPANVPVGQVRIVAQASGTNTNTLAPATPTTTVALGSTATETITLAPTTGLMSGGSGPILAGSNFTFAFNGQVQDFLYGQPYVLDFPYLSALVASGRPVL